MKSSLAEESRLSELEAKAISEATVSVDESFTPSPALLNAPSAEALFQQVDGPSLESYEAKESVYVGKSVPISGRCNLEVPIHVTAPGSIVEYAVDSKGYDIKFSVEAEREEGITVVKELSRVDAHVDAVTGKFLVGSVPCMLRFTFNNEYSWMREKNISYRVTVTPPSADILLGGRRRRAKACQKAVMEDLDSAKQRLITVMTQKKELENDLRILMKSLEEKKVLMEEAAKESSWLQTRVDLRVTQASMLNDRLTKGWPDEPKANGKTRTI
eukprot:CAMPEP_0202477174 /NCGR_PEP_ID=MMETSP1360-20130828/93807_1 /ASSEMBLY_ACC=CAM_ASM_000848 /TAXON_ID=515479 /ORGANISM="Licmophora paradoxa, Strain CCMP2313" /LENGTH=271 /DNA_ID=CAMNT_0049104411 /DNA_START=565 /DNA_END=1380 /DNA_ORIENTATION=-